MSEPNTAGVSLNVLLPALGKLSPPLRIFLARYISTGDKFDAAKVAYPRCQSTQAVQIRAAHALSRKSVQRVLALYRGQDNSELNLQIALADTRRILKRVLRRNANNEKMVGILRRMLKTLETLAGDKSNV